MSRDAALSGWEGFSDEEVDFLRAVERFASRELDATADWDQGVLRRCARLGLQAILMDEGRLEESRLPLAVASSELLTSWSPAVGLAVGASRIHSLVLSEYASPELRDRWLTKVLTADAIGSMAISESEAGSDVRAVRTVAGRVPGGWSLSGEKLWVTLGPVADFTIVLAKLEDRSRDSDMGAFVVERSQEGVVYGPAEEVQTFEVPLGALSMQDVFVPDTHVVAAPGGFLKIMSALNYARLEAASTGTGIQRGALRLAAEHAGNRQAFGSPIATHQAVQLRLGRMATNLEASRALLDRTARAGFAGLDPARLSCLKVFATDGGMAAASDLLDILGAIGLFSGQLPAALFSGAKAAQIYDGTADINLMSVGRAVSRRAHPK